MKLGYTGFAQSIRKNRKKQEILKDIRFQNDKMEMKNRKNMKF